jgi:hypothetical protein
MAKKKQHLPNHGAIPGKGNRFDPRPGAEKRLERKEEEAYVKIRANLDEANEALRQIQLKQERKNKPAPKKKSPPKRKLSINRRKSRIKK